jgi:hypothetical protein
VWHYGVDITEFRVYYSMISLCIECIGCVVVVSVVLGDDPPQNQIDFVTRFEHLV